MDKEAQVMKWLNLINEFPIDYIANKIVEELGYRKLPEGKPPTIGKHGIANVLFYIFDGSLSVAEYNYLMADYEMVIEAQRDADIAFYEGLERVIE